MWRGIYIFFDYTVKLLLIFSVFMNKGSIYFGKYYFPYDFYILFYSD